MNSHKNHTVPQYDAYFMGHASVSKTKEYSKMYFECVKKTLDS